MQTFHYSREELAAGLDRIRAAGWEVLSISAPTTLRKEKVPLWRVFALQLPVGQLQLSLPRGNTILGIKHKERLYAGTSTTSRVGHGL